jgi:N-methylhydantoinase B
VTVDPILVGVIGNRLHSILAEQQNALVNTAFSSVVRESFDLACAVFDSRGEMIGQSIGGTPGHINAMATGMHHFLAAYPPESLVPGDVLLTNDPWQTAGQINDITVATPVFLGENLVAWFASCCHAPDIGGRLVSAEASEVFEEGLRLPIMKFLRAGEVNADLELVIRANVRTPEETLGDLYAQVTGNEVGAAGLVRLLGEFGLTSLDDIAAEIMNRSERALRAALAQIPDGVYTSELATDEDVLLKAAVTVAGEEIHIDFAGSSPQSTRGINVVLNYTRAYASFAVKAAIAPGVPHNAGSFRPVHVTAPVGSVLNCTPPAPVASRHLIGHFLPSLLISALHEALPGNAVAYSADALWMTIWRGEQEGGREFMLTVFQTGGMGARAVKDGLNTTGFPSGLRSTPTEVVETMAPLIHRERVLRMDSGGAGRQRGGLGQSTSVSARGEISWSVNGNIDRTKHAASGVDGGGPGALGRFGLVSGAELPGKSRVPLGPEDVVEVLLPGAGGYGDPLERPAEAVLADVVDGYVSIEAAREEYGVDVRYLGRPDALVRLPEDYRVDAERTAQLRTREKS